MISQEGVYHKLDPLSLLLDLTKSKSLSTNTIFDVQTSDLPVAHKSKVPYYTVLNCVRLEWLNDLKAMLYLTNQKALTVLCPAVQQT